MYQLPRRFLFLVLLTLALAPWPVAAQTSVTLAWEQPSASSVTGYRVSLDGAWRDYGATLVRADGGCICSLTMSLANGAHTFIVAAYNADADSSSTALTYTVGPPTNPASPGAPTSPSPATGSTGASVSPTLTWNATGATTYDVSLGTTNPPSTVVASALTTPSYQGTLTASTPYFWQVVARNSSGATSSPVWSFTTPSAPGTSTVPAPWANQDIGAVGTAGSTTFSSGTFKVGGGGVDIWGAADAFQFVSQPLSADGEIVAQITDLPNTHGNAKAGVMLRGSLTDASQHVMLNSAVDGSIEFISRSSPGAAATYVTGAMQSRPIWLKLARAGSTVTAAVSYDGQAWSVLGSTVAPGLAYAGLVVTSGDPSVLNVSTFNNASVTKAAAQGALTAAAAPVKRTRR